MALTPGCRPLQPLNRLLADIAPAPALPVAGLALDSRELLQGDLFIALPGERHDGREFLAQAREAGASAVLAEQGLSGAQRAAAGEMPVVEIEGLARHVGVIASRYFAEPSAAMTTVGVTGTNGKTTTSRLLAQILRPHFGHCGVIGTLGATLDNQVVEALNTTPDAIRLQRQLADWRDQGVGAAVLEVSSHSLVQHRVAGLAFNTAIFTNLSRDHLDYHGDMESYAGAKALLFASPGLQHAVVNRDDPWADVMIAALSSATSLHLYSLSRGEVAVSVSAVRYHNSGLEARVHTPWGDGLLRSPLAGDFNLSNLLAALTAACLAGMPLEAVLEQAARVETIAGRMQYIPNSRGLQLVVDYAHTPDALAKALAALRAHTAGRLWVVFGCGGDRDTGKRPEMGRIATALADRVVITSDNPRGEAPLAIIDDVLAGVPPADVANVAVEADRAGAIAMAVSQAQPGDCVLVAGKGHENYQIIGGERLPFSDVQALREALS
ncbi:MAG: UDP-N-acetylmuramoyl-L-alanyl-D-glutamate--2,6-diaminopimelate ligase [Halieaceae bacterium]|jgi:UDP-N-acetylmuramoyl-L-alanyl-D-glutamate--2,6-diaminopimelate ligase|nr:UDP-N-acetylmuramoyl-L-alanyl-D-glutamate--2,6-diaminopimelate ligase [Halieaceae bacterium]